MFNKSYFAFSTYSCCQWLRNHQFLYLQLLSMATKSSHFLDDVTLVWYSPRNQLICTQKQGRDKEEQYNFLYYFRFHVVHFYLSGMGFEKVTYPFPYLYIALYFSCWWNCYCSIIARLRITCCDPDEAKVTKEIEWYPLLSSDREEQSWVNRMLSWWVSTYKDLLAI